jgi:hypothetical protein
MIDKLMGLNVIMPLLEVVHSLIKFVELCMCDFIAIIKICERDVCWMYCDIHSSFQGDVIKKFQALINCAYENINLPWIIDLNT